MLEHNIVKTHVFLIASFKVRDFFAEWLSVWLISNILMTYPGPTKYHIYFLHKIKALFT
jgi:hypothetical protein